MTSISYFEKGRGHYLRKEYEEAVKYFMLGVPNDNPSSLGWLGHCYEFGLGVDKDLSHAKDLYNSSMDYLGISRESEEFGLWLKERLNVLKDIPSIDSESRHIPGLGNVRVKRGKYSYQQKKIRCNKDEVVVDIERRDSILSGFLYAKNQLPTMFSEWTCDGKNKFYDGYTLKTDFFTLLILKAPISDYKCIMDDSNLTILVPEEACFEYLYVQSHILKKAKELLFKRAEIVIPKKLREVADRVGASFKKCEIVMSQKGWLAMNCYRGSKMLFCATNVQLPEKSLEALCIHELAHNYVLRHDSAFYKKMIELGGEEAYKLDQALFKEGKWPYLKF